MTDAAGSSAVTGSNQYQYNEQAQGRDSLSRQSEVGGNNVRPIRPSAGNGRFGEAPEANGRSDNGARQRNMADALSTKANMLNAKPTYDQMAKAQDVEKRQQWWSGAVKDGVSYAAAAGVVAASNGFAALTQPLFRSAANMLHHAMLAFKRGDGGMLNRIGLAFGGALKSLMNDVSTVMSGAASALKAPKHTMAKKLLSGAEAPKTWGQIGALLGGFIGGVAGGPLMAGVGFAAGRYAGQAVGRLLSYATGNSGLTLGETLKRAITCGFVGLSDEQAELKLNDIHRSRGDVKDAIEQTPANQPLSDEVIAERARLLQLADALEHDYFPKEAIKLTNQQNNEVIGSYPWQNYIDDLRFELDLKYQGSGLKQSAEVDQPEPEVTNETASVEVQTEVVTPKAKKETPEPQVVPPVPSGHKPAGNVEQGKPIPQDEVPKRDEKEKAPKKVEIGGDQTPGAGEPKARRGKKVKESGRDARAENIAKEESAQPSETEADTKTETWGEMFSRWGSNAYSTAKSYLPFQG